MSDAVLRKGFEEFRRFINPIIAQRASLSHEPIRLLSARDGMPIDADGRAIEDLHGVQAFGHRHPAITAAVRDYLDSDALSWFPSRVNPFAGRVARRLSERTGFDTVFLPCTGSGAVEAALKLARAATGRPRILAMEGAYHGCTFGSVALMSPGPFKDRFAPHLPGVETLPFGDIAALERALAPGDVAAVVVEPIQGEGGVRALPADYVRALCTLTSAAETLLVADEVQTGLGRAGENLLFSVSRWPRRQDVAILGKALGGGLVPISAMMCDRAVFLTAYGGDFARGESNNTTFAGNPVGCVAALAALDLLTDELIQRIRDVGARFRDALREGLGGSPLFEEVRGEGLMIGVALKAIEHPWLSFEHFGFPDLADHAATAPLLCHRLYRHGFFAYPCGHDWRILRLQPRFDIPEETLAAFVSACRQELDFLVGLC